VDQAVTLFGAPARLSASVRRERDGTGPDDAFDLTLEYPSGLRVSLGGSCLARIEGNRFEMHGTVGSFVKRGLDPQEGRLKNGMVPSTAGAALGEEAKEFWGTLDTSLNGDVNQPRVLAQVETRPGNYFEFYKNLARAIHSQNPELLLVKPIQAAATIQILHLAVEASRTGTTVNVPNLV
jgi:scyllo-inositol 2-dehydrogenase (NADP+)